MWQTTMVKIVRHLVDDVAETTYDDGRLEETVAVAAQLLLNEIDFEQTYTINLDTISISPDPTTSNAMDESFITIVSLKAACILVSSELKSNSLTALRVVDGPSTIDNREVIAGLKIIQADICGRLEHSIMQYKAGISPAGQAILSPYSPGSDTVRRIDLDGRTRYFE